MWAQGITMRLTAPPRKIVSTTHTLSAASTAVALTVRPSASVPVTFLSPYTVLSTSSFIASISIKPKVSSLAVW